MTGWWVAAFVVQWILLVALALVVVALARQIGVLHLRLSPLGALEVDDEGPPIGQALPARTAKTPDGTTALVGGPGPMRLVAFTSPTCPICERVIPAIPTAAGAARLVPQVVSDRDLEAAYGVPGVPFLLVLDTGGVVRSKGTVNSLEQIEGLIDTALRRIDLASEARAG